LNERCKKGFWKPNGQIAKIKGVGHCKMVLDTMKSKIEKGKVDVLGTHHENEVKIKKEHFKIHKIARVMKESLD
jgi:hypothetical protein